MPIRMDGQEWRRNATPQDPPALPQPRGPSAWQQVRFLPSPETMDTLNAMAICLTLQRRKIRQQMGAGVLTQANPITEYGREKLMRVHGRLKAQLDRYFSPPPPVPVVGTGNGHRTRKPVRKAKTTKRRKRR